VWEAATICPRPCKLTFDLSTLKVVSRVTCDVGYLCANFSLSVLELGQMFVTDRETSDKATLNACALWRRRRNNSQSTTNNIINLYVKSHDDCHIITAATSQSWHRFLLHCRVTCRRLPEMDGMQHAKNQIKAGSKQTSMLCLVCMRLLQYTKTHSVFGNTDYILGLKRVGTHGTPFPGAPFMQSGVPKPQRAFFP